MLRLRTGHPARPPVIAAVIVTMLAVALVVAAPVARADTDRDHRTHLTIGSVFVDFDLHLVVINGVNLTRKMQPPSVALLGGPFLDLVSAHDTQVVASLPIDIQPGDYRLWVSTGNGDSHNDFWDLTIGAVGPKGDKGEPGATGATGATGQQGPQGLKGETGAPGLNGKDGAPGVNGKDGAAGKDGLAGADGAPGPQGPGGVRGFQEFLSSPVPTLQPFVVPEGVTRILVELWGGSGGGGGGANLTGGGGGGGGYARAVVNVVPGQTLRLLVGSGGFFGNASTNFVVFNGSDGAQGGATQLRDPENLVNSLLQAFGGGGGHGGSCSFCNPAGEGGAGGGFDKSNNPRITSFLARRGFSGGTGATAGFPGRGGRLPFGTVEPFGKFEPRGGDGGASFAENGQIGAQGYALISW